MNHDDAPPVTPPPAPRRPAPPPLPTREEIAALPLFEGLDLAQIVVVASAADAEQAVRTLRAAGAAGFDTESKPTFRKDEVNTGPHLVQFAIEGMAWLFQLGHAEYVPAVAELIAAPELRKIGFGLSSDRSLLRKRLGVEPQAVIDLDQTFRQRGYRQSVGVKTAVALVFGQRFVKSRKATTSNWANARLTEAQIRYAANDAYAAWRVHEALQPPAPDR